MWGGNEGWGPMREHSLSHATALPAATRWRRCLTMHLPCSSPLPAPWSTSAWLRTRSLLPAPTAAPAVRAVSARGASTTTLSPPPTQRAEALVAALGYAGRYANRDRTRKAAWVRGESQISHTAPVLCICALAVLGVGRGSRGMCRCADVPCSQMRRCSVPPSETGVSFIATCRAIDVGGNGDVVLRHDLLL
jgi:hypothetical protein